MRIRVWGARGSIPTPLTPDAIKKKMVQAIIGLGHEVDPTDSSAVQRYVDNLDPLLGGTAGGNTACIEIQAGHDIFIIDAGSGIRELGQVLMDGPCGQGKGKLHLFFSHAHWDHIQGFPFFRPAFVPGNQISIYHAHPYDWEQEVLAEQQHGVFFPVGLSVMQADLKFKRLQPKQNLTIGQVKISSQKMNHPGDAYAYRFEDGHSIFVYASDAEYKAFDEPSLRPYLNFFKGADVLIFDSQYSLKEATFDKADWGHSSALIGVDLARRAGVKKLVLFHHNPTASDEALLQVQAETMDYQAQDSLYSPCEVLVAYEGLTFELTPPKTVVLRRVPKNDAAVLMLSPIFDERSVEEFEQQLDNLAQAHWPSRLIIDLSQVESLAVVGLNPLITLRREYPNTMIALVGLSDRVRHVIKLAGFLDFFAIYPNVEAVLATPQIRESTGQLVNSRYQIEDEIGESWLGVVFKALDTQTNTMQAIKILSTSFSAEAIESFLNQARQLFLLDHPNIVNVLDCDKDQGLAYIVQELMEGQTLRDALLNHPDETLSLDQAINVGLNIALAMAYAHGRGIIHGDLRPQNIFLTADLSAVASTDSLGTVQLTDFGLGRLREGKNLLEEVLILKTAHYLAPEQIVGEALDARTDLYALGVIMYELVSGRPPFTGSDKDIMEAHLKAAPPALRRLNPQISRSLEHFILKLLAKNPDERYATAYQTQRVLSNLGLNEQSISGGLTGLSRQSQHKLIGRDESVQTVLDCWQQAQQGQGQLILIAGETGIGKSRLTEEIALLAQPGTLLVGHCQALEGSLAYQPFIESLRTYFATVPLGMADNDIAQLLSNVAHWIPEIRTLMPDLPEAPPLAPKQEQLRLMNSLAQYIERATTEHPWLLILEDLHWADQSSLQLLHYLARHCTTMALLIVGTYRDTDLAHDHPLLETLHDLQQAPGYKTLPLERLSEAQVGQMLGNIWEQTVPNMLIEKIYQVTEGNPFYVEEVAKGLVDDGTVRWLDGAWRFSNEGEIRLPKSVRDAVLRRVDQLSLDTQSLLRQAAVLGRTFSFEDLQQMSNLSEWATLEHLDVALERQLIEEAPGDTMLRFSHAEIQQVLYQELSTLRRRLLHRQAGEALEMRFLSDPRRMAEELAHHFDEAGEFEKALIYAIQAARHADAAYASQTALMWYERALKVLRQLDLQEPTQEQTFELLLARERLYGRQGRRDKQRTDLEAAKKVAQELNDLTKLSQVHNRQAYYYRLINDYDAARQHAELALQAGRQAGEAVLEGESLSNLAYIEEEQGQYPLALQHMEAAQTFLEKTDDRRREAIALKGLGTLHQNLNNYEQAQAYYERALAMNQDLNNRRGEAACLNNLGELERERGNYALACAFYEQTLGMTRAIGDRLGEAIALQNLSLAHLALGSYETAKSYIEQAVPIYRSIADDLGIAEALNVQSAIHHALAEYKAAYTDAQHALEIFQSLATPADIAEAHLCLGLALEGLDDFAQARVAYTQALENLLKLNNEANALDARAGIARCSLAEGQVSEALAQIEQSLTWLMEHSLAGLEHPFRFYLTAYQVAHQAKKSEMAEGILVEAHTLLQERAAQVTDEALRQSYLEKVPQNRAIIAEWEHIGPAS